VVLTNILLYRKQWKTGTYLPWKANRKSYAFCWVMLLPMTLS